VRLNTGAHAQPEIFAPDAEESPITSLALIETTPASLIYAPGALASMVDRVKAEVRAQLATLDVSIPKDKARIILLSARVASAKVKLDKMGADLTEEHRTVVTAVNADRKSMRDDLDAFKVEVRKPVTDLENAEKERMAAHEAALAEIEAAGPWSIQNWQTLTVEAMRDRLREIDSEKRDWQEFSTRAAQAKAYTAQQIFDAIGRREKYDAEQIELARLRAEAAERSIKEREEAAARVAKEAAERRAEEQARIAREAAERERQRVENERAEAEARAKQAEAERIAAEERAVRELKEAEGRRIREAQEAEARRKLDAEAAERRRIADELAAVARLAEAQAEAKRVAEQAEARRIAEAEAAELAQQRALKAAEQARIAAVAKERLRLEDEQREARIAAETRAKNKAHRLKIDNEVLGAIVALDIPMDRAQDLLIAIAKGAVPHVTISY
jgi:hypothetical protein